MKPTYFIGIVALLGIVFVTAFIRRSAGPAPIANVSPQPEPMTSLTIEDIVKGTGPVAATGDTITVHYRGTLADGTEFDSSYNRNTPFTLTLGVSNVITGWQQGLLGMQKGGKRKLVIPPDLAYGATGQGSIPPNATLTFEIELLDLKKAAAN